MTFFLASFAIFTSLTSFYFKGFPRFLAIILGLLASWMLYQTP